MSFWGFYFIWKWGRDLIEFVGLNVDNETHVSIGCITVTRIYSMILFDLPFAINHTFVLEQKHNFNNQTVKSFIKDQILKFIIIQVITI
jgi:STE24 endopeptidase